MNMLKLKICKSSLKPEYQPTLKNINITTKNIKQLTRQLSISTLILATKSKDIYEDLLRDQIQIYCKYCLTL